MSKYISIHGIARDNVAIYKLLHYLRPAITRAIMVRREMSYREAATKLREYLIRYEKSGATDSMFYKHSLDFNHEANKLIYRTHVTLCYEYCLEDKTFRCNYSLMYYLTPDTFIQLPLRYRNKFHKLALSTMVLNKLTK